jgi:hypothetical protein
MAVLPPYNDVYTQLIVKTTNQLPQIVVVGYKIDLHSRNTYSVGKPTSGHMHSSCLIYEQLRLILIDRQRVNGLA